MLKILIVFPVNKRAPKAPMRERGMERRMVIGWMKLSNWAASTMYARTMPRIRAKMR